MAQQAISLDLAPRAVFGKAVKHLRSEGVVPAVIHNHGQPSIHVQADKVTLLKVWRQAGKHHPVELRAGEKRYTALIKTIDFDPRKHQLTHIVFNAVDITKQVEAEIPIRPRYEEGNEASPAERGGLIVLTQLENVAVKALPSDLPDSLEYDAEKLVEIGDHATVANLIVPSGVEVETEAEHTIATVYEPSALAAANESAGGTAEEEVETEEAAEGEEGEGEGEAETSEGGGEEAAEGSSKPSEAKQ